MAIGIALIVVLILTAVVGISAYRQWQKNQEEKRREQEYLKQERAEARVKERTRLE